MPADSAAPRWPSLPIVTVPIPPHRRRWTWRDAAIRSYRVVVLAAAAYLLLVSDRQVRQQELGPAVTLAEARRIFPAAGRLGPRDLQRDGHPVLAADGAQLGFVLKTAPHTDDLIGYAGPSNLLIGLSADGRIVRVLLLSSGDTSAHVAAVRDASAFWQQFSDRPANGGRASKIEGVSGSTLTSLAMAEGVHRRLSGPSLSLRFPDEVTLAEVQEFFPQATIRKANDPRRGWNRAADAADATLGYVIRTSPTTDSLIGYAGPTETLFAVATDQQTIRGVRLRKSYDSPEYVERVGDSEEYFSLFVGKTLAELREIDYVAAGIEGVSGATQTSYAVAEGLRRCARVDAQFAEAETASSASFRLRDGGLAAFVMSALVWTFSPGKKDRRLRAIWQLLLIAGFGLWFGDLLSLSLLAGWARHGLPIATAPVLVVLVGVSLFIPWTTKQQIYCHQLCPHGAAQEWLGRFRRWHLHLPSGVSRGLGLLPGTLLAGAFLLAVMSPRFDLAVIEPFDGWILKTGAAASFTIAITSLAAAIFVPQVYCRYGCPTGALLKFVRSHSNGEHFGIAEWAAAGLLVVAALQVRLTVTADLPTDDRPTGSASDSVTTIGGEAFGTTWSVKVRGDVPDGSALYDQLTAELERIESRLSHWRTTSETSQFNASATTLEWESSQELIDLIAFTQTLSAATDGAYDITVGPLVDAWGYGPSGPKTVDPTDEEIQRLLLVTGWQKLHAHREFVSLQKDVPELQIDLGSVLQGYATDRLAELLVAAGCEEFLIDVGGELHARGAWKVAIEGPATPAQVVRTVILKNAALATTGTYRPTPDGRPETRHIIDPKTGQPVASPNVLCTVIAPTGRDADAWATALFSLTPVNALDLAKRQGLSALLVDRTGSVSACGEWE